jgi:hypothetical protein
MSPDPVSWLVIEPGWHVLDSSGGEVGRVEEVVGDSNLDIFDGLAIATSIAGHPRYVAAEQVAGIVEGAVTLTLDAASASALPEYQPPGETIEVSSEKAGLGTRLESDLVPSTRTEHVSFLRRILLWFGLAGKR